MLRLLESLIMHHYWDCSIGLRLVWITMPDTANGSEVEGVVAARQEASDEAQKQIKETFNTVSTESYDNKKKGRRDVRG